MPEIIPPGQHGTFLFADSPQIDYLCSLLPPR